MVDFFNHNIWLQMHLCTFVQSVELLFIHFFVSVVNFYSPVVCANMMLITHAICCALMCSLPLHLCIIMYYFVCGEIIP